MSSELAQFSTAREARKAYAAGGGSGGPGSGGEWTEWARIDSVENWHVYGRESVEGNTVQFHITGTAPDGRQIFLESDGSVVDSMVIYESMNAVNAALEAYFNNEGNVDPGDQPTGNDPGPGAGGPGGGPGGGPPGSKGKAGLPIVDRIPIVGGFGPIGQAIFVVIVVAGIYYYQNDGDLSGLPIVGDQLAGGSA